MSFPYLRELFTFEGWYIGDEKVTDINGTMLEGKEILQRKEREIYAKWTANEHYTYKLLIVYITKLDVLIPDRTNSSKVQVNYKMTDFERQMCHAITKQMKTYLDDMFDGLVTFEVDEYFTENLVTTESVTTGLAADGKKTNWIMADRIPEVKDMLDDYQSVFTSFSLNDVELKLHNSNGVAGPKYGAIYFDTLFLPLTALNEPIENLFDLNYWGWVEVLEPFNHELAHTIEMQIDAYEYNWTVSYYQQVYGMNDNIEITKLYFNNKAVIDGVEVGIPIEFWAGKMNV